jgi:predicted Fe-S protein YdhL (DUF1289 family)
VTIRTPCIDICVLHRREGICIGCFRTGEEIARWSTMTDDERDRLIAELPTRADRLRIRRGGRDGRLREGG